MNLRPAAKTSDLHRLRTIVAAAAHVFALAGYHRTQMADIAARAGVALGTLYRHAASKEDLFGYALTYGAGGEIGELAAFTPIHDVEAFFADRMPTWFDAAEFPRVLFDAEGVAALPAALDGLYAMIERRRLTIRIVDRSAHDLPGLGETYARHVREPVLRALTEYFSALQADEKIAPLPNPAASARFALEVCAWFAMHRLFSPGGPQISDEVARSTALSHLVAAFGSKP